MTGLLGGLFAVILGFICPIGVISFGAEGHGNRADIQGVLDHRAPIGPSRLTKNVGILNPASIENRQLTFHHPEQLAGVESLQPLWVAKQNALRTNTSGTPRVVGVNLWHIENRLKIGSICGPDINRVCEPRDERRGLARILELDNYLTEFAPTGWKHGDRVDRHIGPELNLANTTSVLQSFFCFPYGVLSGFSADLGCTSSYTSVNQTTNIEHQSYGNSDGSDNAEHESLRCPTSGLHGSICRLPFNTKIFFASIFGVLAGIGFFVIDKFLWSGRSIRLAVIVNVGIWIAAITMSYFAF